jgi:hypothetical protein
MRREIDDAQQGGRKKAAHKSRAGGHSPAEAGRGSGKRPLEFEEEEAEPRRRISGGSTRRESGASGSRGDAGGSRSSKRPRREVVSEEEEEEEPTELGKNAESTAFESEDELQREPSPKKTKKKEGGEEADKGSKRSRAEGIMHDTKTTMLKGQAKVIVLELVAKKVLDPANLWTARGHASDPGGGACVDGLRPLLRRGSGGRGGPAKKLLHVHVSLLFTRIFFICWFNQIDDKKIPRAHHIVRYMVGVRLIYLRLINLVWCVR